MKEVIKKVVGEGLYLKLKKTYREINPTQEQRANIALQSEILNKKKNFYQQFVSPNSLCFDVGANMGDRVDILLSLGAEVVAVEPQQDCCDVLKNKFGDKITLEQVGLAAEEGELEFYMSDGHCVSSFSKDWINSVKDDRLSNWTWREGVKIKVSTLDNLIAKYGVPQFIKIDVEGFEHDVLKGLTRVINAISFEYTVPEQTQKAIDCISYLGSLDVNTKFNFSPGETMSWYFKSWKTMDEMISFVNSDEFANTSQGDIYAKTR